MDRGSEEIRLVIASGGARLDACLAAELSERRFSRSALQRWIEEGRVTLNGCRPKPSAPTRAGDVVTLRPPPPPPTTPVPVALPFGLVYEDEACLVVDKPAGMVTHPAKGHREDTLVNALLAAGLSLSSTSGLERPGILHRLDKGTSGLLVVAKSDSAHANLSAQFSSRSVKKVYLALLWGEFPKGVTAVDSPIGRDPKNRKRMAVVPSGRAAITEFQLLESLGCASLVEARPLTGRTHQIRVHSALLGQPVVGDALYGGRWERSGRKKLPEGLALPEGRFLLHARRLFFLSPIGKPVEVESEVPSDFTSFIEGLKGHEQHKR